MNVGIVLVLFFVLGFFIQQSYADEIWTTLRIYSDDVIFDGKWSFLSEWKDTSEDKIIFDDGKKLAIRTGHDYENLYVMINFISDTTFDKNADYGIVCIDGLNDQTEKPNLDDYCFSVSLGTSKLHSLQGGSDFASNAYWKKIENNPAVIAVGGMSDKNDRYTKISHATYEFKIPIEIFGRSDVYGFYVGAFDAHESKIYGWPDTETHFRYPHVPEPENWGNLVSPDKSIPEFEDLGLIIFSILSITIVFSVLKQKKGNLSIFKPFN